MNTYALNQYLNSLEKYFFNSSDNIVILDKDHEDLLFNNYILVRKEYEKLGNTIPTEIPKGRWRYSLSPQQKKDKVILIRNLITSI